MSVLNVVNVPKFEVNICKNTSCKLKARLQPALYALFARFFLLCQQAEIDFVLVFCAICSVVMLLRFVFVLFAFFTLIFWTGFSAQTCIDAVDKMTFWVKNETSSSLFHGLLPWQCLRAGWSEESGLIRRRQELKRSLTERGWTEGVKVKKQLFWCLNCADLLNVLFAIKVFFLNHEEDPSHLAENSL